MHTSLGKSMARAAALAAILVAAPMAHGQTLKDLHPQLAQLVASGGAVQDYLGYSVAIDGDTMVVGAPFDDIGANSAQGSATVFVRSGSTWTQQQQLTMTGGGGGDYFGWSVAISGDTIAVGAKWDTVGANTTQGSAVVFVRNGSTWTQQQQLTMTGGSGGDTFGASIAIDGQTIVVGAVEDDVGANSSQGSAVVFVRDGLIWTQQTMLTASGGATLDLFGASVAIDGDTIVVGATGDDVGAAADQGSVHVFVRSGTVWSPQATLTASGGAAGDLFGNSVAIDGDRLVAGAYQDDVGADSNEGSVAVFGRIGAVWTQLQTLTRSGGAAFDSFGRAVDIEGDTIVATASSYDATTLGNQGATLVFVERDAQWNEVAALVSDSAGSGDLAGGGVSLSGDTIAMGIAQSDFGGVYDQGSVALFGNYRVLNDTSNIGYTSLAAAIAGSSAGSRLLVGATAFEGAEGIVDASQKRFNFVALEPIAIDASTLMTVATNTAFERSPDVASAGLTVAGDLSAPQSGTVTFEQLAVTSGGQFLQRNSTILVNQGLSTASGGTCYLQGPILAESVSTAVGGQNRCAGDTDVFANYNNAGSTIVQRGVLYIYGSLVNTGTMTGEVDNGYLPPSAGDGYSIGGDYTVAAGATLALPDPVWWLRVGGDLDIAIDDPARFAMSVATIELTGLGDEPSQSLEVFARDLGAVDSGFATTNFLLGTLRVRTGANVSLVDIHNNAPGKTAEAIYTESLVVPAGATLVTNGYRIYTRAATIAGTVSNPADIVVVPGVPPCPEDLYPDGEVNAADLSALLVRWGPCTGSCEADLDGDSNVGAADLAALLVRWGPCGAN
jgi:hypothetical protein